MIRKSDVLKYIEGYDKMCKDTNSNPTKDEVLSYIKGIIESLDNNDHIFKCKNNITSKYFSIDVGRFYAHLEIMSTKQEDGTYKTENYLELEEGRFIRFEDVLDVMEKIKSIEKEMEDKSRITMWYKLNKLGFVKINNGYDGYFHEGHNMTISYKTDGLYIHYSIKDDKGNLETIEYKLNNFSQIENEIRNIEDRLK